VPMHAISGTQLGEKCYGVRVEDRVFNVYLK
jgi:hypothetical protein